MQDRRRGLALAGGSFHNIANHPIDYNPYDPDYHDVNLLMGPDQLKPPATLAQGETAPLGTYIPTIDPDVYFAHDGRQYLYTRATRTATGCGTATSTSTSRSPTSSPFS